MASSSSTNCIREWTLLCLYNFFLWCICYIHIPKQLIHSYIISYWNMLHILWATRLNMIKKINFFLCFSLFIKRILVKEENTKLFYQILIYWIFRWIWKAQYVGKEFSFSHCWTLKKKNYRFVPRTGRDLSPPPPVAWGCSVILFFGGLLFMWKTSFWIILQNCTTGNHTEQLYLKGIYCVKLTYAYQKFVYFQLI